MFYIGVAAGRSSMHFEQQVDLSIILIYLIDAQLFSTSLSTGTLIVRESCGKRSAITPRIATATIYTSPILHMTPNYLTPAK